MIFDFTFVIPYSIILIYRIIVEYFYQITEFRSQFIIFRFFFSTQKTFPSSDDFNSPEKVLVLNKKTKYLLKFGLTLLFTPTSFKSFMSSPVSSFTSLIAEWTMDSSGSKWPPGKEIPFQCGSTLSSTNIFHSHLRSWPCWSM